MREDFGVWQGTHVEFGPQDPNRAKTAEMPTQGPRQSAAKKHSWPHHICLASMVAILPTWEKIDFGLLPEIGKKWPENGVWPHRENREKIAQKLEKSPENWKKSHFWVIFPIFRRFFPDFPGDAKIHFRAIFFRFRAEARNRFSPRSARSQLNGTKIATNKGTKTNRTNGTIFTR